MWLQTKMHLSHSNKHGLAFLLACVLLSGCGFHLKQASYLPKELQTLHLSGDDSKSELFSLLRKDLVASQVTISDNRNKQVPELHLYRDSLTRQTLSLFRNGQVAQYELAYSVSYRVTRPGLEPIDKGFEIYRNYQDDPDNALAKAKELDIILNELRKQASKRIVRELSQL
ncbi:LPS assembly lipoprotein LptE [Pseudoalteromonas phenolica]|uniref:LPS-assembly lipoprotein LptE n=2 Tax=Pseudoalteromonas phenolica TaxID=161398 RepID=A0A0S2K4T2_9GAMM|nr:LPS-assembly lipoprotein LptE [Pseudoalteromonas phenolica]